MNHFTKIINVSGTMTGLGASIASESVAQATSAAMKNFIFIHEAQRHASTVIAELTGAEKGFLTASASAAITLSVAAAITGLDAGYALSLPKGVKEKSKVVVQAGHLCSYGAPIATAIELAGAKVVSVGQATQTSDISLDYALDENTCAALYVVSHHTASYGMIPFERFVEICHAKNVMVIVDAASEMNLCGFIEKGADIAIYSAHKFIGGPTAGIVAGKKDAIRAAYLQNIGIGRGFKVGKETILGACVAMKEWLSKDRIAERKEEKEILNFWKKSVEKIDGIKAYIKPDPTGNLIDRLELHINHQKLGANAAMVADALANHNPSIIIRNHFIEHNIIELDPCNLKEGQSEIVAKALKEILSDKAALKKAADITDSQRNGTVDGYLSW